MLCPCCAQLGSAQLHLCSAPRANDLETRSMLVRQHPHASSKSCRPHSHKYSPFSKGLLKGYRKDGGSRLASINVGGEHRR